MMQCLLARKGLDHQLPNVVNEESKKHAISKFGDRPGHRGNRAGADQSLYSHGFQHQDDFECCCGGRRRNLGITIHRSVGTDIELSDIALRASR